MNKVASESLRGEDNEYYILKRKRRKDNFILNPFEILSFEAP